LKTEFRARLNATLTTRSLNESVGIIHGVVLDPELANAERLGEAIRLHERREADLRPTVGSSGDGQQFAVAPHGLRARLMAAASATS
jgi:hypothetical protein